MRKPKFQARGHYTEFYTALWHQRAVYPPVLPGTDHVLVMWTFGGEIKVLKRNAGARAFPRLCTNKLTGSFESDKTERPFVYVVSQASMADCFDLVQYI